MPSIHGAGAGGKARRGPNGPGSRGSPAAKEPVRVAAAAPAATMMEFASSIHVTFHAAAADAAVVAAREEAAEGGAELRWAEGFVTRSTQLGAAPAEQISVYFEADGFDDVFTLPDLDPHNQRRILVRTAYQDQFGCV